MSEHDDIFAHLTERAKADPALRSELRAYFGRGRMASAGPLGPGAGLRLLETLSRVPRPPEATDEQQLYAELVALAFEHPELRGDLLPLLTCNRPEE